MVLNGLKQTNASLPHCKIIVHSEKDLRSQCAMQYTKRAPLRHFYDCDILAGHRKAAGPKEEEGRSPPPPHPPGNGKRLAVIGLDKQPPAPPRSRHRPKWSDP
jgi:hypothetical protein